MIDALISGRLLAQPIERTGRTGQPFVTSRLRVATDGEAITASCICFDAEASGALLALGTGDAVALAGTLTPKVWTSQDGTPRPSADLVVHKVLTPYHVTRRRRAMRPEDDAPTSGTWGGRTASSEPLDDGGPLDF